MESRLLIQYKSNKPEDIFGGPLEEKAVFETFEEAVMVAIPLISDITINAILVNDGSQWVRIK
jgi:hypothetical protein